MKSSLASFTEEGRLSEEQLSLLYLRDIALVREVDPSDEGLVDSVLENLPNGDEVQAIITKREEQAAFAGTHLFETGDGKIGNELYKIRQSLLNEPELVEPDNEETFNEQIQRSISDKMIAALNKYCKIAKRKKNEELAS